MHDHDHEHGHDDEHLHHHAPRAVTFDDCIRFHGHSCPGLACGYRAATAAMEALGVSRPEDEDLVALCETDACGVDAIQVIAGTTAGKGNLVINDCGKYAFTFFNRKDGKAVRITFRRNEGTGKADIVTLRTKVFSNKATRKEEEVFHELMHTAMLEVLHAPADTIMKIEKITMDAPEKARIFPSVTCEECGESVADAKTREVNGKCVCLPCAERMHLEKKSHIFSGSGMDFEIRPIGYVRSPYKEKKDAPRQGRLTDTVSEILIDEHYLPGLEYVEKKSHLIILTWFDRSDRTLLKATPPHEKIEHGVFATRSPNRPNPVAFSVVDLLSCDGKILRVRGLDALDGTPVVDIKPYSPDIDCV